MNVQNYLENKFNTGNYVGLSCAISHKNKISQFNFGKSNLEYDISVTDSSIFNIASVGKLLTAVSILKLVEEDKINLKTNVGEILKDIPEAWKNIQVDHLLSHSSGIKNYTDSPEYWAECRLDVSRKRILEYVWDAPLHFEPGTQWRYSNTGFYLLGLVIEEISKLNYFEFAGQIISGYNDALRIIPTNYSEIVKDRVQGYELSGEKILNSLYYSPSGSYSAGGFSAALKDFIQFENALFNGEILESSFVELLGQPFIKTDGEILRSPDRVHDFEMAHGLFKFIKKGKIHLAHRGEIFGFSTVYMRVPEDNFSLIISTNLHDREELTELGDKVYELVAGS